MKMYYEVHWALSVAMWFWLGMLGEREWVKWVTPLYTYNYGYYRKIEEKDFLFKVFFKVVLGVVVDVAALMRLSTANETNK